MEALGKHHIHKYPSKFTENLSNLTQKEKIEKILNIYPKGIESIIEELPPGENTVYIMLVLKGSEDFIKKYISIAKRKNSEDYEIENEESGKQLINLEDDKSFITNLTVFPSKEYLNKFNGKNEKIKEIKDIQIKIKRTQRYINYLIEIFSELNRSEDKLIEKIVKEYSFLISKKLKEENPDYYNEIYSLSKEANLTKDNFYEFSFEDFILLFCSIIKFYTGIKIKLELRDEKSKKVLLSLYIKKEEKFESIAEFFGYELQLKPYALKFEEFFRTLPLIKDEKKKQMVMRKLSITYNSIPINHINNNNNVNPINPKLLNNLIDIQFYDCDINNCLFFPPYIPFERNKSIKFRKYLANDNTHLCTNDPEFVYMKNKMDCEKKCSKFRNIDKLRLIYNNLDHIMNFSSLYKYRLLNMIIYKRNYLSYGNEIQPCFLFYNFIQIYNKKKYLKAINTIRNFFGESVGYYFLFICFFSYWTIFPSITGIIIAIIIKNPPKQLNEEIDAFKNFRLDYYDITLISFCLINAIWATSFLKAWKQQENIFRYFWGMEKYEQNQITSEFFIPDETKQFILGENIKIKNYKSFYKKILSFFIILILISIRFSIVIYFFFLNPNFNSQKETSLSYLILLSTMSAFVTKIYSAIIGKICYQLSIWENYETRVKQQNSQAFKLIIVEFFNNFSTLFYISFYKPYQKKTKCYNNNCLKELEVTIYLLLFWNCIFTSIGIIFPFLVKCFRNIYNKTGKKVLQKNHNQSIEHQLICTPKNNLINEFTQKMIRFGFVCLFSVGAPLTPLFVLIINIIESFADIYKLFNLLRVEIIDGSSGIGIYNTIFRNIYFIGTLINVSLILFTSPKLARLDLYLQKEITNNDDFIIKILIFAILENLILIYMNIYNFNILPIWFYHLGDLKVLYDKKYYSREITALPHLALEEKKIS